MRSGDVKQWSRQQGRALFGWEWWQRFTASKRRPGEAQSDIDEVGRHVPVRTERSLGSPRGSGCVEDCRIVIGIDDYVRQRRIGKRSIVLRRSDQRLKRGCGAKRRRRCACRDQTGSLDRRKQRRNPLQSFLIDKDRLRIAVRDRINQLVRRAPRIYRHDNRARDNHAPEYDDPFGDVAHCDRNPIPLFYPEPLLQDPGKPGGCPPCRPKRKALLQIHDVFALVPLSAAFEDRPHILKRCDIGSAGRAVDQLFAHLERSTWCS